MIFSSCVTNLVVFTENTKGSIVNLDVYVDDLLVIRSDEVDIQATKGLFVVVSQYM